MLKSSLVFGAMLAFSTFGQGTDKKAPRDLTADYIKVEIRGRFRVLPRANDKEFRAQVVVAATGGQKRYELDLPADKALRELAEKLNGEAALITGELVTIYDLVQSAIRPYPPRDVVRVRTLTAAGPEK
jgi:hypothetical protein